MNQGLQERTAADTKRKAMTTLAKQMRRMAAASPDSLSGVVMLDQRIHLIHLCFKSADGDMGILSMSGNWMNYGKKATRNCLESEDVYC